MLVQWKRERCATLEDGQATLVSSVQRVTSRIEETVAHKVHPSPINRDGGVRNGPPSKRSKEENP